MIENCILAFGGNAKSQIGQPQETINYAYKALRARGVITLGESRAFRNPAFPAGSGPDFVNTVAFCETNHSAHDLLAILHEVEAKCGRERLVRWGARTLDIDLVSYGSQILPNEETHRHWRLLDAATQQCEAPSELILPHPRLQDRAFVLVPMAEVAPDWCHPILGLTTAEMMANLPESELKEVVPL